MDSAPSTNLYYLGKGVVSFDRLDAAGLPTGMRDLGNVPNFSIGPAVEKLDHFSSREGVKKKDKTVILSAGLNVKFTLEEYDLENLALALFGEVSGGVINLMQRTAIEGHLKFVGAGDVGPKLEANLWKVSLNPTGEVPFITDNWGAIELEGEILSDAAGHASNPYGTLAPIVSS
jgi:hypothetical protein